MRRKDDKIWLFSFSDLAFLLLIAFTQTSTIGKQLVKIGEMNIPKVVKNNEVSVPMPDQESYQIRVNKPPEEDALLTGPFQVVKVVDGNPQLPGPRLTNVELLTRLEELRSRGVQRPMLLPDEFSLSRDMLMGMSMIEKTWTHGNKVTVQEVAHIVETGQ